MQPALLARQIYASQYTKRYSLLLAVGTLSGALIDLSIGVASDLLGGYRLIFQLLALLNAAAILIAALLGAWEKKSRSYCPMPTARPTD